MSEIDELLPLAVKVIRAYLQGPNAVPMDKLGDLIGDVHAALARAASPEPPAPAAPVPAVPPSASVYKDYVICLECGSHRQLLKRHIMVDHGMTVPQYRHKWGLPPDYPVTAPSHSARRSEIRRKAIEAERKE